MRRMTLQHVVPLVVLATAACGAPDAVAPQFEADPKLDFGNVQPGETRTQTVHLRNTGSVPVRLFASLPHPTGHFQLGETLLFLDRRGEASLDVTYAPGNGDSDDGELLQLRSTDSEGTVALVHLGGHSRVSCGFPDGEWAPANLYTLKSSVGFDGARFDLLMVSDRSLRAWVTGSSDRPPRPLFTAKVASAKRGFALGGEGHAWFLVEEDLFNPNRQSVLLTDGSTAGGDIVVSNDGRHAWDGVYERERKRFAAFLADVGPKTSELTLARVDEATHAVTAVQIAAHEPGVRVARVVPLDDGEEVAWLGADGVSLQLRHVHEDGTVTAAPSLGLKPGVLHTVALASSGTSLGVADAADLLHFRHLALDGSELGPERLIAAHRANFVALHWTGRGWLLAFDESASALGRVLVVWLSPEGDLLGGPLVASCSTSAPIQSLSVAIDPRARRAALAWVTSGGTGLRIVPLDPPAP